MSGIYIKGIPMPERGNPIGVLIYPDGTAEWPARDIVGTAIPVPDHGRLIDADGYVQYLGEHDIPADYLAICKQPTIIPADPGGASPSPTEGAEE